MMNSSDISTNPTSRAECPTCANAHDSTAERCPTCSGNNKPRSSLPPAPWPRIGSSSRSFTTGTDVEIVRQRDVDLTTPFSAAPQSVVEGVTFPTSPPLGRSIPSPMSAAPSATHEPIVRVRELDLYKVPMLPSAEMPGTSEPTTPTAFAPIAQAPMLDYVRISGGMRLRYVEIPGFRDRAVIGNTVGGTVFQARENQLAPYDPTAPFSERQEPTAKTIENVSAALSACPKSLIRT